MLLPEELVRTFADQRSNRCRDSTRSKFAESKLTNRMLRRCTLDSSLKLASLLKSHRSLKIDSLLFYLSEETG